MIYHSDYHIVIKMRDVLASLPARGRQRRSLLDIGLPFMHDQLKLALVLERPHRHAGHAPVAPTGDPSSGGEGGGRCATTDGHRADGKASRAGPSGAT